MGLDLEEDMKRLPVELNLKAARKRQSTQTGFVHHCYENEGQDKHDTIPVFENFCFSLALLRSKQTDNVLEGIALLTRLISFEVEGNFPVYLHEFPQCRDRYVSLRLLPLFHWVLKDFHAILDTTLLARLDLLIARILSFGYSFPTLPPVFEMLLKGYFEPEYQSHFQPNNTDQMAFALIASRMAQSRGGPLNPLHQTLVQQWHPQLHTFVGAQEQEKIEPKPTLYDLYLCDYHRAYPKRLLVDHPVHLRASLIYPQDKRESIKLDLPIPHQELSTNPRQPYALYWGSADHLHTLVCDPREAQCRIELGADHAQFSFQLAPHMPQEDAMEIAFFCDQHPAHTFTVKSTTFQLGEAIEIHSGERKLKLTFSLTEGEGIFFGHIMRANRPLQTMAKGPLRHEAYDWQISLRTIKRTEHCVLRAHLEIL